MRYYLTIIVSALIIVGFILLKLKLIKIPAPSFPNVNNVNQISTECNTSQDCVILSSKECCPSIQCDQKPKVGSRKKEEEIKNLKKQMCQNVKCVQENTSNKKCLKVIDYIPICLEGRCKLREQINCEKLCLAQIITKTKSEKYEIYPLKMVAEENFKSCECSKFNYDFIQAINEGKDPVKTCQEFQNQGIQAEVKTLCEDYIKNLNL